MNLLEQALTRTFRMRLLVAFGCSAFGVSFCYILVQYWFFGMFARFPLYEFIIFCLIDAVCVLYGLYTLFKTIKTGKVQNDLLATIEREPNKIVWLYPYTYALTFFGLKLVTVHVVYLWLNNGKKHVLHVAQNAVAPVLAFVQNKCPAAVYGYSAQNRKQYAQQYYTQRGWYAWYLHTFPRLSRITEDQKKRVKIK